MQKNTRRANLRGCTAATRASLKARPCICTKTGTSRRWRFILPACREGPTRVYDDEKRMILYARYTAGKENGVTLLFKGGVPWFVQEWNAGTLEGETLLARKGTNFSSIDHATELADAREKLAAVKKELVDDELASKIACGRGFQTRKTRYRKKDKALRPAMMARIGVAQEKERQERDARVARAHPYSHRGGAAAADEGMATRDLKADKGNVNALAKRAKGELHAMDAALAQGSRQLYDFALTGWKRQQARRRRRRRAPPRNPTRQPENRAGKGRSWSIHNRGEKAHIALRRNSGLVCRGCKIAGARALRPCQVSERRAEVAAKRAAGKLPTIWPTALTGQRKAVRRGTT